MSKERHFSNRLWSIVMTVISVLYMYPIFMVLINSLKEESAISTSTAFELPTAETFAGLANYENAIGTQGFLMSLFYTTFITVTSVLAILIFCSMFAWYITRVHTKVTKALYMLCAFSMVVPFQMVMFTLSSMADTLKLNTPWVLWVIYLGFGAGLAVFMFCGFMRSVPIDMEEASMIDGCNPLQTYFHIVLPLLRPTMVSVAILEAMWIWNDYLLPTLILDINKYRTISMLIQFFRGSYGRVEMGPMMACIMLAILPIIVIYLIGQKYIIKGVVAGAVKG
ncbi:MAG TPA: carbohydrate ABC transporter permease [Candidatus Avilachnospira avistercoris]|nr:carbohydrate ABC transporter permease [Candidatus Avilachnospira avistercoris]